MKKEDKEVIDSIAEHAKIELSSIGKMLDKAEVPPGVEALVEGPVISIQKSSVYIDLAPFGTGIIYCREFINAKDIMKKINIYLTRIIYFRNIYIYSYIKKKIRFFKSLGRVYYKLTDVITYERKNSVIARPQEK
jgi:hypothetical protein